MPPRNRVRKHSDPNPLPVPAHEPTHTKASTTVPPTASATNGIAPSDVEAHAMTYSSVFSPTTVAASPPIGLIVAPEPPLTVRVGAYPSREPLAEVALPPGAALADLRRAIRDAPDMAHRPERLFARWWASGPGGECGTERELPCAEGGGGLGADPPSLRSVGITEDYSLVLVGAGEGDGEEDPLVAALGAAAVVRLGMLG